MKTQWNVNTMQTKRHSQIICLVLFLDLLMKSVKEIQLEQRN